MITDRHFKGQIARSMRTLAAALIFALAASGAAAAVNNGLPIRFVDPDRASGTSAAVVVRPDAALAHTALLEPVNNRGEIVDEGDAGAQADRVLSNLNWALAAAGSGRESTVKITVYAANAEALGSARDSVAQAFPGTVQPAVTWIINRQPDERMLVTMDAVAVAPLRRSDGVTLHRSDQLPVHHGSAHVAVMPPGDVFHVAGQVAPGETLAEAARETVLALHRTIGHFGLAPEHVVQVKAFINPMEGTDEALRAIAAVYEPGQAPPVVITEWQASLPRPTEIELIAVNPRPAAEPHATRYLAPPWMSTPAVFSRVAAARSDAHKGWIYFSGIVPPADLAPEEQVAWAFDVLETLCERTGSNFDHLVKATYYVGERSIQQALGAVRPDYYDPQRPPAASLVFARGGAQPEAIYTLDMIGVRVE